MQRRFEISTELTRSLYVAFAMLACSELLGIIGSGLRLYEKVLSELISGTAFHDYGALALNFLLLFVFARPSRRSIGFVLLAGTAANFALLRGLQRESWSLWTWIYALGSGFGLASLCAFVAWIARGDRALRRKGSALLAASLLILVYVISVDSFLVLVSRLHPQTFDFVAWLIDSTLGFHPSQTVALLARVLPGGLDLLNISYGTTAYGFAILFSLQQRGDTREPANIYSIFVFSALIATLFYQLCPIAGPAYAFRADFPLSIPAIESLPHGSSIIIEIAPRNGIPSMHLGWALLLWMNASYAGRWARAGFAILVGLTVLATLGLGEHYLIDLVAGVPMAVAIQALCTHVLPWNSPERRRAALWGFAMVLGWIGAVRFGLEAFLAIPGLTWAAVLGTLWASVRLYQGLVRETRAALARPEPTPAAPLTAARVTGRRELRTVALMFALSGFAGLAYQVLVTQVLSLNLGGTASATYSLFATCMGGMAIGAWLGGRLAAQRGPALKLYAYCALGIGLYCLLTPWIVQGTQTLYVSLAGGMPADSTTAWLLRLAFGAAALGTPTVLMGMTLPILARFVRNRATSLGASVALLFGANMGGAALGVLVTSLVVIPALGVLKTMLLTALVNLLAAAVALRLSGQVAVAPSATAVTATLEPVTAEERRLGTLALLLMAAGGAMTLALQATYTHLLAAVAGDSVYAFSMMLFAFVLGLAGGTEIARRLIAVRLSLAACLAWTQFSLAAMVLLGAYQWASLPGYFASFAFYPVVDAFGTRELVRGLVCGVAILPPAVALGALYPLAMEAVGRASPAQPIRALGRAAALYSAGHVAGILAACLLLNEVGTLRSLQGLAMLCLLLGLAVVGFSSLRTRWPSWAPAVIVLGLLGLQPVRLDYTAVSSGASEHFAPQAHGEVIDWAESVDGGITAVARSKDSGNDAALMLLGNGKLLGSNAGGMASQMEQAVAPFLSTSARERALVIGYGTGIVSHALHQGGFAQLDIVEPSRDRLRLADAHFGALNGLASQQRNVNLRIADGRAHLLLQPWTYDVVAVEISSLSPAGAASLYSREFYQLAKKRLRPHGVLQEWVPLHHLAPLDLLYILGSVRAEFSHVWLYNAGSQGLIIASNDPSGVPPAAHGPAPLLDPARTDRLLASYGAPPDRWISTDDNLYLEYAAPKGNVLDAAASLRRNLDFLKSAGDARP